MKRKNYKYILLFITITVVATISLQLYWNFKNYKENQRQFINEVQLAFDNSIEYYYVEDVKNDFVAFVNKDKSVKGEDFLETIKMDTLFRKKVRLKNDGLKSSKRKDTFFATNIEYKVNSDEEDFEKFREDSIKTRANAAENKGIVVIKRKPTVSKAKFSINDIKPSDIKSVSVFKGKKSIDSISAIKDLANRIVISMVRDSIDFKKLSKNLDKELARKNIAISYAIGHYKSDSLFERFQPTKNPKLSFRTTSKSTYLPQNQKLKLEFSNPTLWVLKRSITEIILSFLLSLAVIGCMLYLLRTINKQKKVDEIKNDLISNITHEFKTPITTISTAIEGIKVFNVDNDPEKTKRYLSISENQLKKLQQMVEKLLETSTLETDKLTLKKEKNNLTDLIQDSIDKHQMNSPDKEFQLHSNRENLRVDVDVFHFENVISNLIDNAIKYGGTFIRISIEKEQNQTIILIEDNGKGIEKKHREKIFEKFYRIPKGNIHDVKGFGIGLYYSKKIIEKHGGSLKLLSDSQLTSFKITLPNDA